MPVMVRPNFQAVNIIGNEVVVTGESDPEEFEDVISIRVVLVQESVTDGGNANLEQNRQEGRARPKLERQLPARRLQTRPRGCLRHPDPQGELPHAHLGRVDDHRELTRTWPATGRARRAARRRLPATPRTAALAGCSPACRRARPGLTSWNCSSPTWSGRGGRRPRTPSSRPDTPTSASSSITTSRSTRCPSSTMSTTRIRSSTSAPRGSTSTASTAVVRATSRSSTTGRSRGRGAARSCWWAARARWRIPPRRTCPATSREGR